MTAVENTAVEAKSENVKILVETAKIKQHINNTELADILGISRTALWKKINNPSEFRLGEIWMLSIMADIPDSEKCRYM